MRLLIIPPSYYVEGVALLMRNAKNTEKSICTWITHLFYYCRLCSLIPLFPENLSADFVAPWLLFTVGVKLIFGMLFVLFYL